MYGYNGYVPGQSTTYTTSAVAAAVAAAYSGSAANTPQQPPNVFGYPTASTFGSGMDGAGAAAASYYGYGYGAPGGAPTAAGYPNLGAGAGYASLSDLSYAAKGRAPYGATAPKPNPALTTLTTANKAISSYGGSTYDAAVYAAASNMLNKGPAARTFPSKGGNKKPNSNPFAFPHTQGPMGGGGVGGGAQPNQRYPGGKRWGIGASAATHRDTQQFYCEVCKISCAGQLTYKEHLEGKLHKKKELLAKGEGTQALPRSKVSFRCDLCNVTCTGKDTYDAHVRGSKHQRTLALCKKLGKPIPAGEPTIIAPAELGGTLPKPVGAGAAPAGAAAAAAAKIPTIGAAAAGKKIAPMHFVGGSALHTTKQTNDLEAKKAVVAAAVGSAGGAEGAAAAEGEDGKKEVEYDLSALLAAENNVKPVGEEFVETERDANGKHVTYACKLCDCKFSDINAKDIHLKGRRHRLMYKQKVDPTLQVEVKPNTLREKRAARQKKDRLQSGVRAGPPPPGMMGMGGPGYMPPPMARFAPAPMPRPYFDVHRYVETEDDRHIMAKHATIFPDAAEIKEMEDVVQSLEKALKGLSDHFETTKPKEEGVAAGERLLKGAMRIGVLSKGLMQKGEEEVELVALFAQPPTKKILEEAAEEIKKFIEVPPADFSIDYVPEDACLTYVVKGKLPRVKMYLTSTVLRAECPAGTVDKPADILREEKCLTALAELRHSKWFQVRCTELQSCQVVLRILRDIAKRIDTYKKLAPWTTELIVEKVISSVGVPIPVGDALRRFFEAVSTGILFESGPGLLDPCEKDGKSVLAALSAQDRENITSSAQHALRLIAFGQIHKILGMEKLPAASPPPSERKRPREEEEGAAKADGEKTKGYCERKRPREEEEGAAKADGDVVPEAKKDKPDDESVVVVKKAEEGGQLTVKREEKEEGGGQEREEEKEAMEEADSKPLIVKMETN
ncbi:hypothetical protein PRIPAC_83665 [Pristionchus pacificus]|uniref:DZF domain-containing protein n=1 Tax=Pristionchus pacificus TaxID=54126 RepID=A0A2A6BN48_PRIPA|nr:hypothetical protein PRIPAC_83665 [Pristionchus pacificus]|eukprot:PDM67335.1 hypothetical protein PRIPAC_48752 [Pristionchus pacificus]